MIIKVTRNLYEAYNKFVIKYPLFGMAATSGCELELIRASKHYIKINIYFFQNSKRSWNEFRKFNLSITHF